MAGSCSIPKLALCLGTTTDYLFGLTDDPKPPQAAQPEGQMMICGWMPGSVPPAEPGDFAVIIDMDGTVRKFFRWDGERWYLLLSGVTIPTEDVPRYYLRLPEYEGGEQDD